MQAAAGRIQSTPESQEIRRPIYVVIAALAVYVLLAAAYIYTAMPSPDEGMFADPAITLATRGYLGSRITDPAFAISPGVVRHIYYMPPLHFVLLAGWYKIFGMSLFSTRWLSAIL